MDVTSSNQKKDRYQELKSLAGQVLGGRQARKLLNNYMSILNQHAPIQAK